MSETPLRHYFGRATQWKVERRLKEIEQAQHVSVLPAPATPKRTWRPLSPEERAEREANREQRNAARRQRQVEITHRRKAAFDLWVAGKSWRVIGEALGISHSQARADVAHMHDEQKGDFNPDLHRKKNLARQERLIAPLMEIVENHEADLKARVAAAVAINAVVGEQAKLLGMHAPLKVASTTPDGQSWAPLAVTVLQTLSDEELALAYKVGRLNLLPKGSGLNLIEGEVG